MFYLDVAEIYVCFNFFNFIFIWIKKKIILSLQELVF